MRVQIGPYCTMAVKTGPLAGVISVCIDGELDTATTGDLWPVLQEHIEQADRAVVLDLTDVKFFGSAGIKALMDGWQATREHHIGFAVVATHERVLKPLRITKADEVVLVRADLHQAADAALLDRIAPDRDGV